jgi:hypothetical protein
LTNVSSATTTSISRWLASGTIATASDTEIHHRETSKSRNLKLSVAKQAIQRCDKSYCRHAWGLSSFTEYLEYSEGEERNVHKIKAFKTAISALDNLPFQVQRIQDVEKVRHAQIYNGKTSLLKIEIDQRNWCGYEAKNRRGSSRRRRAWCESINVSVCLFILQVTRMYLRHRRI